MQAGLNALMAINAAPVATANASATAAAGQGEDAPAGGNPFAQLLSDSGAYSQEEGAQQSARGQLAQASATGVLLAQDIAATDAAALEQMAAQSRDQLITAQDAAVLVKKVDAMLAHSADVQAVAALNQIKTQLQAIEASGQPKTVAEVMEAAPAWKETPAALAAMATLLQQGKKALEKQGEEEATAQANAAMQHLSAAMFRSARREAASAAKTPGQKEETDRASVEPVPDDTIVVIEPMAYLSVVPAQPQPPMAAATAAITPRPDLDQAIPSLELKGEQALPPVELPKVAGPATQAPTPTEAAPLSALEAAAKERAPLDAAAKNAAEAKDTAAMTTLLNAAHTGGHSATQTASAVQPASQIPAHVYINHAPVSEQVHVAIRKASGDGIDQLTIQLDPAELGRVEVKMLRAQDGQTQISFTVDKPETFDSLSRDARMLERSLQEAGIKADTGSMQFNLRQQPQPQLHSGLNGQGQQQPQQQAANETDTETSNVVPLQSVAALTRHYTINIREGVDISA